VYLFASLAQREEYVYYFFGGTIANLSIKATGGELPCFQLGSSLSCSHHKAPIVTLVCAEVAEGHVIDLA
jgi:hypothetical protein